MSLSKKIVENELPAQDPFVDEIIRNGWKQTSAAQELMMFKKSKDDFTITLWLQRDGQDWAASASGRAQKHHEDRHGREWDYEEDYEIDDVASSAGMSPEQFSEKIEDVLFKAPAED
jgi:hypothetical protein